jgi:hypothetical protein
LGKNMRSMPWQHVLITWFSCRNLKTAARTTWTRVHHYPKRTKSAAVARDIERKIQLPAPERRRREPRWALELTQRESLRCVKFYASFVQREHVALHIVQGVNHVQSVRVYICIL